MAEYTITNNQTGESTSFDAEEMEWIAEAVKGKAIVSINDDLDAFAYEECDVRKIIDKLRSIATRC